MSQNSTNSLKIIFDTTLEKKEIKEFEHLANKLELDLTTPDKQFSEFEHKNIIIINYAYIHIYTIMGSV